MISANIHPAAQMSTPVEYNGAPNSSSGLRYHLRGSMQTKQFRHEDSQRTRYSTCEEKCVLYTLATAIMPSCSTSAVRTWL